MIWMLLFIAVVTGFLFWLNQGNNPNSRFSRQEKLDGIPPDKEDQERFNQPVKAEAL